MWSKETSHFLSICFLLMACLLMAAIVNKLCIANVMKSNESWPQNHAERHHIFDIVCWNGWKWHPQMLHQSYKKRNFLKRLKSLQVKICTVVWMETPAVDMMVCNTLCLWSILCVFMHEKVIHNVCYVQSVYTNIRGVFFQTLMFINLNRLSLLKEQQMKNKNAFSSLTLQMKENRYRRRHFRNGSTRT